MQGKGSVIIIGSGLGGLQCGVVLSRHGYKVTVLEKHFTPGGCLQTFVRGKAGEGRVRFDCGFHYVGSVGKGEPLGIMLEYYGLGNLPWKRLDEDCFDEICFVDGSKGTFSYPYAMGFHNFSEKLSEFFPESKHELEEFVSVIENVCDHTFSSFGPGGFNPYFSRSAKEFLEETISDPQLRKVLSGPSLKMELSPNLPLYIYSQIFGSFIRSAYRLDGGGETLINPLCDIIRSQGGEVLLGKEVVSIDCSEGRAVGVTLADGTSYKADYVISDAHPSVTMEMVGEEGKLRGVYRRRISSLSNTYGVFTANIRLKKDAIPYLNRNVFIHRQDADLWNPEPSKTESLMVHFYPEDGRYASRMDVMTPMDFAGLSRWKDLPEHRRGEKYEAAKQAKWEECLSLLESRFPGIGDCIEDVYTSTPLTWLSYIGTPEGSAYGVRKNSENVLATVISAKTPVEHLYLTGQSLNLHGILGVSMSSILTCGEILGLETLRKEILHV